MQLSIPFEGTIAATFNFDGKKERYILYGHCRQTALRHIGNEWAAYGYCKKYGVKEEISENQVDFSEINKMLGID